MDTGVGGDNERWRHNLHNANASTTRTTLRERATRVLQCITRFESALREARYRDAAVIAAESPERVLRTLPTWDLFKAAKLPPDLVDRISGTEPRSPLAVYAEELVRIEPDEIETLWCVKVAINAGNVDQIAFWMQQRMLFYSPRLAELFEAACPASPQRCRSPYVEMARITYEKLGAERFGLQIFKLMLREGSPKLAIAFANRHMIRSSTIEPMLKLYPSTGWEASLQRMQAKEQKRDEEHLAIAARRNALHAEREARRLEAKEKKAVQDRLEEEVRKQAATDAEEKRRAKEVAEAEAKWLAAVAAEERRAAAAAAAEAERIGVLEAQIEAEEKALWMLVVQMTNDAIVSAEQELEQEFALMAAEEAAEEAGKEAIAAVAAAMNSMQEELAVEMEAGASIGQQEQAQAL